MIRTIRIARIILIISRFSPRPSSSVSTREIGQKSPPKKSGAKPGEPDGSISVRRGIG